MSNFIQKSSEKKSSNDCCDVEIKEVQDSCYDKSTEEESNNSCCVIEPTTCC
jgi:hypothetical protein